MNALEKALRFTPPEHVGNLRTYDHAFDAVPCVSWVDERTGRPTNVAFYGRNGIARRDQFVETRLEAAA